MINKMVEQNLDNIQSPKVSPNSSPPNVVLQKRKVINRVKNVAPQKRRVLAVKVFMTAEEKRSLEQRMGEFNSISNFIRHHIGLLPNNVGRRKSKKQNAELFNLDETEIENMLDALCS